MDSHLLAVSGVSTSSGVPLMGNQDESESSANHQRFADEADAHNSERKKEGIGI